MGSNLSSVLSAGSTVSPYVGVASGLLSLFGGGKKYDPTQDPNYQHAQQFLGAQTGLRDQYGDQASQAGSYYNQDNPAYRQAVASEADYLRQDPGTATNDAAYLANATAGSAAAYQRANAQLTASLASRGIVGGSALAGGVTQSADAYAGQQAAAQNALAQQKIAVADQHRNALLSLLGGQANRDYSQQQSAMGNESGLNNSLYNDYSAQAAADEQRQASYQQQQDQQQQAGLSAIGTGLSGIFSKNSLAAPVGTTAAGQSSGVSATNYDLSDPLRVGAGVTPTFGNYPSVSTSIQPLANFLPRRSGVRYNG